MAREIRSQTDPTIRECPIFEVFFWWRPRRRMTEFFGKYQRILDLDLSIYLINL
jgi:hypothetical protein